MSHALLEVEELAVRYGPLRAVNYASFSLERKKVLGIVGESGSGKSTLIWALTRLLPDAADITSGAAWFDGQDLLRMAPDDLRKLRGTRIAYISQDPLSALVPSLTIGEQMTDILYREPWSKREKWARATEVLDWVSLPDPAARMNMYPYELSGGQRQRVSIAMALMLEPDLVLADEPTTALDATLEVEILELLRRLQTETECAVILVTHHLGIVASLCDEVLVMHDGVIREAGNVEQVLTSPRDDYTRRLLKCDPARIAVPTRRLPTMTDDLDLPLVRHDGPGDRIKSDVPPILALHGLQVVFRKSGDWPVWLGGAAERRIEAVKGVSLDLRVGETVALVGESGSGKTTIARAVMGLVAARAGSIKLDGEELTTMDRAGLRAARSRMAMMFQDPTGSLSPRMTLGEQVVEPLVVHGAASGGLKAKARELLAMVGLGPEFAGRYPHEISGGQARRVGVARALALSPDLIIADEPTAGLDVSIQGDVINLLNEIQERTGISILIITHNMSVVRHTADRLIVLLRGAVVEQGPTAEVFASPAHGYTRALIAASIHQLPDKSEGSTNA